MVGLENREISINHADYDFFNDVFNVDSFTSDIMPHGYYGPEYVEWLEYIVAHDDCGN